MPKRAGRAKHPKLSDLGPRDEISLMRAWTDWNSRSRKEYLDVILKLPPKERRKDRGASWGSVQDIFLHVIEDYIWWFEHVPRGETSEPADELVGRDLTPLEIQQLSERVERSIRAIMDPLGPADLGRPIAVTGVSGDGKPYKFTTCLADIIWHMVEEELQHRGELNALLWQLDIDPPTRAWFSSKLAFAH